MKSQMPSTPHKTTDDKLAILQQTTAALLEEVRSLSTLKMVEPSPGTNFNAEVRRFEIYLIEQALTQAGGCQSLAAKILGLKATTLNTKIKRYRIRVGKAVSSVPAAAPSNGWGMASMAEN